ncbi:alpha/beta hydrolase [Pseudotenacibaculum haliotis]|uniref:Alpha/beta hydrolase n=1 Tax=Pseudotenacibaculum haliotis TaxID=1862138 RepID=A0ABW5LN62_9FLAO
MRTLILLLLVFSFSLSFGQKTIYKKYESDELKDIRDVTIHLPKGYEKDSISNFPLAIVLDGQKLFDLYVGVSNYYASQDNAPEQIVVGVNMESTRSKDAGYDVTDSKLTTDARRFYRFLRDELIPFVEANYKTSPFLTIVGESLTANFITHFLKEKDPIFNAYISINPTLAPDVNAQVQSYNIERLGTMDNTFYFYVSGNPYAKSEKLTKIQAFGKFMKSIGVENFNVVFDELSSSPSSASVIGEGMSRAFAKIFEIYSGITQDEYDKKIKELDPPSAIAYLETKYLDIEYLFGSNIGIRQQDVVAIEDIIIEKENGDYLKDFGEMILKLYPTSEMGNYYLGRYFESGNDFKAALEQYRLGYGKMNPADPNADLYYLNVERMLEKL